MPLSWKEFQDRALSREVSQESPATVDSDGTIKRFLAGLEIYAPVILNKLAEIAVLAQQHVAPYLEELAKIDWDEVKRRVDEVAKLPEKSKATMILASSKGWFFGWNDLLRGVMDLIKKLEAAAKPNDIDEIMIEYYRENFQFFTDELVNRHPDRASVINAAVMAHRTLGTEGYILSIPVFIAQADGLLGEIAGVSSAASRVNNTREFHASKALRERLTTDQETLDLIYPLLQLHVLDFMKSAAKRQEAAQASGDAFTALNRHQVMHGELFDYGTEINSLKAFSFLAFVGAHLPAVLEHGRPESAPVAVGRNRCP